MGSSLKKPGGFFHKFDQNVPTICLSHSLRVLSKNTQWFAQNILGRFIQTYSKETRNLVQFYHKLSKNPLSIWLGTVWADCWVFCERSFDEWLRHMMGTFWSNYQRTHWVFSNKSPHRVLWWVLLKLTHHLPTDPIKIKVVSTLRIYPPFTHWVKCGLIV